MNSEPRSTQGTYLICQHHLSEHSLCTATKCVVRLLGCCQWVVAHWRCTTNKSPMPPTSDAPVTRTSGTTTVNSIYSEYIPLTAPFSLRPLRLVARGSSIPPVRVSTGLVAGSKSSSQLPTPDFQTGNLLCSLNPNRRPRRERRAHDILKLRCTYPLQVGGHRTWTACTVGDVCPQRFTDLACDDT